MPRNLENKEYTSVAAKRSPISNYLRLALFAVLLPACGPQFLKDPSQQAPVQSLFESEEEEDSFQIVKGISDTLFSEFMREYIETYEAENDHVVLDNGNAIYRYKGHFDEQMSPEEYANYVAENATSPSDIAKVVSQLLAYRLDINDRLYSAESTLSVGYGDCDNKALVAKYLLDHASEIADHDFKARVIAMSDVNGVGHSVTVFTNFDGKLYILNDSMIECIEDENGNIDLNLGFEDAPFDEVLNDSIKEVELVDNMRVGHSLNFHTLERDYRFLHFIKGGRDFELSEDLLEEYRRDDYSNVKIFMPRTGKGKVEFESFSYEDSKLVSRGLESKNLNFSEIYFPGTTRIQTRIFFKNSMELYSKEGELWAIYYYKGPIKGVFFKTDGTVKEIVTRDGAELSWNDNLNTIFSDFKIIENENGDLTVWDF